MPVTAPQWCVDLAGRGYQAGGAKGIWRQESECAKGVRRQGVIRDPFSERATMRTEIRQHLHETDR